jgi:uncharacterized protein YoxC
VASIVGAIGTQASLSLGNTYAGFTSALLVAFIYFWGLRVPAAFLEIYITKGHRRRWVLVPHALGLGLALFAIAGNESHPTNNQPFQKVASVQAVSIALFYYLICALAFLILTSIVMLTINLVTPRKWEVRRSTPESAEAGATQVTADNGFRSRIARIYRTQNRDAAVFAVSITTAVAGVVQGIDLHDIARTIWALALGVVAVYVLSRLPNVAKGDALNKTTSSQERVAEVATPEREVAQKGDKTSANEPGHGDD